MINIWGTYCSPCIAEMPEIEELSESLPDNAAVIGLVSDVYEGIDPGTAIDITEDAGVEYSNLVIDEGLAEFLYEMGMQYVPTTVFVDSEGYVLGEPVIGVDPDSYKSRFESYGISFE
jgi:thiol-disulfide isomerase/thioredoxin